MMNKGQKLLCSHIALCTAAIIAAIDHYGVPSLGAMPIVDQIEHSWGAALWFLTAAIWAIAAIIDKKPPSGGEGRDNQDNSEPKNYICEACGKSIEVDDVWTVEYIEKVKGMTGEYLCEECLHDAATAWDWME
jgi:hypothetical protein